MINALERVFSKFVSGEDKMNAAMILHRYRRASGDAYLEDRLRTILDQSAAIVFAREQRQDLLPLIIKAFKRHPSASFASVLGPWKNPEIKMALEEAFKLPNGKFYYALALAQQGDVKSIPAVRKVYLNPGAGINESIDKLEAASSLIKLGAPESKVLIELLIKQLSLSASDIPFAAWKMYVITALADAGTPESITALSNVIEGYLTNGIDKPEHDRQGLDILPNHELAVYAAEALVQNKSVESYGIIEQLFLKVKKDHINWNGYAPKLAKALMILDKQKSQKFIEQAIGPLWTNRELVRINLKPIFISHLRNEVFNADLIAQEEADHKSLKE